MVKGRWQPTLYPTADNGGGAAYGSFFDKTDSRAGRSYFFLPTVFTILTTRASNATTNVPNPIIKLNASLIVTRLASLPEGSPTALILAVEGHLSLLSLYEATYSNITDGHTKYGRV